MKVGETEPIPVVEEMYHLSFPCVFEDRGTVYMMPEKGLQQRLDLYRAVDFPYKWTYETTLLEGFNYGDPVFYKNGKEYMIFLTEGDNNLCIYTAQNLFGPWDAVYKRDHMHSRAAGNVFIHNGQLIRPVQVSDTAYGRTVGLKEISLGSYEENMKTILEPTWADNLTGFHTFNFDEKHVIIDGRIKL